MSDPPGEKAVAIEHDWDVVVVQRQTREFALGLGFSVVEQAAVATAVSEAATNILKFAGRGTVLLRAMTGQQPGLEIEATDRGPGIAGLDVGADWNAEERRFEGPPSGGLGSGIAAMRRLMDVVVLRNRSGGGLRVIARKNLSPRRP
jgi:serine/threonine-protein kinase RsbT